ncbi:TonB-dependent siderophore receptor [Lysobacter sp. N42]|nr:TonB-dependent siderophore receptor [Aliidiomarina sp. B3213]TCZ91029.1 TonB-dependent siderophore receptor [Lysobacter sp. N42]
MTLALFVAGLPVTAVLAADQGTEDTIEHIEVRGQQQSGYRVQDQQSSSRLDLDMKDTPQMVSVINGERIADFQLNDINSLLENSATINVEQVETDRTYYSSRGFELNNFQIDGLGLPLINSNSHGRMDTALYERVEIVHGANGIMTGVGSPAATVNMVRKRPQAENSGSVSFTTSSWSGQRAEADFSRVLNRYLRGRVVLVNDDSESYLDRYENSTQVIYGVIDFAPGTNTLITIGHSEHRSETDGNMWGALTLHYGDGTPTNFDRSTNIAADWSEWNVKEQRSFIDVESVLSENTTLRVAYNRVRTDEDSMLFYTYLADTNQGLNPDTGLGLIGYGSEYDLDDEQDTFDAYLTTMFDAFGESHQFVVGANYSRLDYVDTSLYDFHTGNGFPAMPALEDWNGNTPFPEFTDGLAGSVIDNTQRAIYAQARLALSLDTHLLIGGRYNEFETEGVGYGVDETRDDAEFIPYIGFTHMFSPETTVYASYTETFMAQNQKDENFERLPALTGKNTELGVKTELFDGKALFSGAIFNVEQENLAVANGTVVNPETNAPETIYRAADGVRSRGVEMEIAGELTRGLQASVSLTSFNIDGDDMVADYTPENLFRASMTYTPASIEALKLGASFQWQDTISRVQGVVGDFYANEGETIVTTQGAYGRLNLMASYQLNDNLRLSFNANNVLDKKYINSLVWAQGYYGAPRNYSASIAWSF